MKTYEFGFVPLRDLGPLDMRPQATVQVEPGCWSGLVVVGEDDLDEFQALGFELAMHDDEGTDAPAVLHVLLLRYAREPQGRFTLFLPGRIVSDGEVQQCIDWVAAALGLAKSAVRPLHQSETALS